MPYILQWEWNTTTKINTNNFFFIINNEEENQKKLIWPPQKQTNLSQLFVEVRGVGLGWQVRPLIIHVHVPGEE